MNTPKDNASLEKRLADFDNSFPGVMTLVEQLAAVTARHAAAGGAINRRLDRGDKNTADASKELRAAFAAYPATLRNLGNNCLRLAAEAEEINKLL